MILTSFQVFGGYQEGIDQHRDGLVSFTGCESGCYLRGCRASKNQETDFSVSVCGPCYLTWKCILLFVYDIIAFSVSPTHIRQCCKFGLNHQMKVTGLRRTCPVLTYIFLRCFFSLLFHNAQSLWLLAIIRTFSQHSFRISLLEKASFHSPSIENALISSWSMKDNFAGYTLSSLTVFPSTLWKCMFFF